MKRVAYSLTLLLLFLSFTYGQGLKIKGTIQDEMGNPLPGANIIIPALNLGTASGQDGKYVLKVPSAMVKGQKVKLEVSFVGYKKQSMLIVLTKGTMKLNFTMKEDIFQSEAVVVTGIASKTSKAVAQVAVSRIPVAKFTEVNGYQSFSQLLTGKVTGVQLKPASGNVGGGFRFFMRSGGGLNGNEQPIIYVDGVRVDNARVSGYGVGGQGMSTLANLDPDDIEKVEVLKGPAGAAMYGTSGSNGVILITTKSGKFRGGAKKVNINYKFIFGYNEQAHTYDSTRFISAKDANAIFRNGLIRQNTLSASGGFGFIRYFASFDNRFENGILENNNMDRTTLRANVIAAPSDNLTMQFDAGYTLNKLSRPNNDNNIYGYLGNTLLFSRSYRFTDSLSIANLKDEHNINQFIGSAKITYSPIKNLEINFTAGIDQSDWRQDQTFPANMSYAFVPKGRRRIYTRNNRQFTYDYNAQYKYSFFGIKANSIVGAQLFDRKVRTSFLTSEKFQTELITDIGSGSDVTDWGEGKTHERQAGIFTEHSFSYNDQYFLSLGLREDYASAIGSEAPSIIYPKASFAIRFDKYNWFPKFFGLFKLRTAYGESGTLPNPRDPIPLLWTAANSGYGTGAVLSAIGNAKIKPERIKEFEVGFDAEFLRHFSFEFTYYRQNASNSIVGLRNAPSTGKTASSVPFNIGAMKAWGIESMLQVNVFRSISNSLDLSLIMNYQTNEVTDLGGAQPIFDGFDLNVIKEGLPKHEFYTWKVKGAKFNSDGTYAGADVTTDRVSFGNPIPSTTGSFTFNLKLFKNLRIYVLADWALGHKIFDNTYLFATRFGNNPRYNELKEMLLDPTSSKYLTPGTDEYKKAADEFAHLDWHYDGNYIFDASYVKLREISISYDLKDILNNMHFNTFSSFMVGVSARNIYTSTKYPGADVEVNFTGSRSLSRGQDFLTLQNPRTYNFWVRIGL